MKTQRKGGSKPSARLAAQKPKHVKPKDAKAPMKRATIKGGAPVGEGVQIGGGVEPARYDRALLAAVGTPKVRFKWVVRHKAEVPVAVGDQLATFYHVLLEAAYEPLSILDGQATVQGNEDNRAFGAGVPKATMSLEIASKAIADTFIVGRAQHSIMTPVEPVLRALY